MFIKNILPYKKNEKLKILLSKDTEKHFLDLYCRNGIVSSKDIFDLDDELIGYYIIEHYSKDYPTMKRERLSNVGNIEVFYNELIYNKEKLVKYLNKISL